MARHALGPGSVLSPPRHSRAFDGWIPPLPVYSAPIPLDASMPGDYMRNRLLLVSVTTSLLSASAWGQTAQRPRGDVHCAPDNGGITLAKGFCATVFADSLPGPRHLLVAPNGDVFVALQSGGVMALRDKNGDGIADERNKFGEGRNSEVALFDGYVYMENGSDILRYRLPVGSLAPTGDVEQVVTGLPTGGHGAKTFTIARDGALYVNLVHGPTRVRAMIGSSRCRVSIHAPSSRRVPASGDSTHANFTRLKPRASTLRAAFETPSASPSTRTMVTSG
jgi:hypothetical protein